MCTCILNCLVDKFDLCVKELQTEVRPILQNRYKTGQDHRRSWHGITTPFLNFLFTYLQYNFFISLLFHLFFLILTCSCQYSYNLIKRDEIIKKFY